MLIIATQANLRTRNRIVGKWLATILGFGLLQEKEGDGVKKAEKEKKNDWFGKEKTIYRGQTFFQRETERAKELLEHEKEGKRRR